MLDFIGTAVLFEKHGDNQYFCLEVWHYVGTKGDNKNKHIMANMWPQRYFMYISLTCYETLLSTRQAPSFGFYKNCICVYMETLDYLGPSSSASKTLSNTRWNLQTQARRENGAWRQFRHRRMLPTSMEWSLDLTWTRDRESIFTGVQRSFSFSVYYTFFHITLILTAS